MKNYNRMKPPQALIIGLLVAWGLVVALCCVYSSRLEKVTGAEVDRYLLEISTGVATTLNARIDSTILTLKGLGHDYFLALETNGEAHAKEILREQAVINGFTRMTVTSPEGLTMCSDDQVIDRHSIPYINQAFRGEEIFARAPSWIDENVDGILYALPIYYKDKLAGVIAGWCELGPIQREMLQANVFDGKGHFHIVGPGGARIFNPALCQGALAGPNLFDRLGENATITRGSIEEMRNDMLAGKSGRIDYTLDDVLWTVGYVPLREDGSYLICAAPTETTMAQFTNVLSESLVFIVALVVVFTALILLLYFKERKNTTALHELALVDPLTGGMNRNHFHLKAEPMIAAAAPGSYSLVSLNVRQFKLANVILGSSTGDRLLKWVHDCIQANTTENELVGRGYADDFILLVTTRDRETTLRIVESVINEINRFTGECGRIYTIQIYLGVYEIDDPSLPLVEIIDRANIAKKSSKIVQGPLYDCVFYSDLERQRMIKTKDIEDKMHDALVNGDFLVYLQPKIETQCKTVVGAEALVRWHDKKAGIISPGEFIPCFESNGFIIKVDLYVFDQLCCMMRQWLDAGIKPVPVSVNLSRAHLRNPDFVKQYIHIRDAYDLPHELLEIELTESLMFDNIEVLVAIVNELHEAGFKCSLDDFGCGYSSLNMLKDIQVDTLKLDGAFWVSPDVDNPREREIITSMVSLARKLGMTTVSEGVETVTQLEFLRQIECDMVQGYVFSKPLPAAEFEEIAFGRRVSVPGGERPRRCAPLYQ